MKLQDCEISTRLKNVLIGYGLDTSEEVILSWHRDNRNLLNLRGLGKKSIIELKMFILNEDGICYNCGQKMMKKDG